MERNKEVRAFTPDMTTQLVTQMEQNFRDHEEIKHTLEEVVRRIDNLDEKFASKWVEKSVIGLISVLISAMLGLFIYLLQRHIL